MWKLQKKVEGLTFYGLGDEAYEYFQATCNLLYMASAYGSQAEQDFLFNMAQNQAEWSRRCYIEMGYDMEEVETAQGIWDYQ
jgi:hypothetical protein